MTCLVGLIEPHLFQRYGKRDLLGVKGWTWLSVKIYRKHAKCRDVGLLAEQEGVVVKGTYQLLPQEDTELSEVDALATGSHGDGNSRSNARGHAHGRAPCCGQSAGSTFHNMGKQELDEMGI